MELIILGTTAVVIIIIIINQETIVLVVPTVCTRIRRRFGFMGRIFPGGGVELDCNYETIDLCFETERPTVQLLYRLVVVIWPACSVIIIRIAKIEQN